MSGIEKVCEYSGEYKSHLMYEYKRNRIQVNPQYRKLFKGQDYTLFRFLPNYEMVNWKNQPMTDYCLYVPSLKGRVNGFYFNWTYNQWGIVRRKIKRLLQCKQLDEIRIPLDMYEAYDLIHIMGLQLNEFMVQSIEYTHNDWVEILNDNRG